ncbi:MAG: metallophosphoesterase [Acutalibacteraceae bacterium]
MTIWFFVLLAVIVCFAISIIFLISMIRHILFADKVSSGTKVAPTLISLLITAAIIFIPSVAMSSVNGIICVIYLVLIWAICELVAYIVKRLTTKKIKKLYTGIAALVLTISYLCFGWYTAHTVCTTGYIIDTDKEIGKLRIIQFADAHIGTTFDGDGFAAYVDEMQTKNPDVVLITGDFVDDSTTREDMFKSCEALSRFNTKYGVFFAYGNHDKGYYSEESRGWSNAEFTQALKAAGVTVLEDESILIDDRFYIVGRKDYSEEQKGNHCMSMAELTDGLDSSKYIIVMDHQPHDYDAQANSKTDLVLSGHTHGGQLLPINYVGEWTGVNCRTYGYEKRNNTEFIVTSGISDWEIKFKTGCISEYVVIDVE